MIAAERPGASADQGIYSGRIELSNITPQFILPDLSMQGHFDRKWGYVQIASMFRRIAWVDNNATSKLNLGGSAFGWGIHGSSNLKFGEKSTGRLSLVYGHGIQNYMNDAPIDIGVQNNFSNPITPVKGVPLPVLGAVAFVDHNWSPKFSSFVRRIDGEYLELRCRVGERFSPGILRAYEPAVLPSQERDGGWRISVWPASEFPERL